MRGREQQRDKRTALADADKALGATDEETRRVRQQLVTLEAQRQGIDALKKKDELEREANQLDESLRHTVRQVLEADQVIAANIQATRNIANALADQGWQPAMPQVAGLDGLGIAQAVKRVEKSVLSDIHDLVQRDAIGAVSVVADRLDGLHQVQAAHNRWYGFWHDKQGDSSNRDQLAEWAHGRRGRYKALTSQRDEKRREIARLEANQVRLSAFRRARRAGHSAAMSGSGPHVLCDHVEVKDPRWQAAIEGYIGGARFSILVVGDYEAEAIRIVRGMPGRDNRARVIQGDKAAEDAARTSIDPDSIIHVLEFSHAVARAYLLASYGTVLRVGSADALRRTRRGLTEDGMGSAITAWRCDLPDSELVLVPVP